MNEFVANLFLIIRSNPEISAIAIGVSIALFAVNAAMFGWLSKKSTKDKDQKS